MKTNEYLINRKEPKRLLIFKSSNRILKSKHLKKMNKPISEKCQNRYQANFQRIIFTYPLFLLGENITLYFQQHAGTFMFFEMQNFHRFVILCSVLQQREERELN